MPSISCQKVTLISENELDADENLNHVQHGGYAIPYR